MDTLPDLATLRELGDYLNAHFHDCLWIDPSHMMELGKAIEFVTGAQPPAAQTEDLAGAVWDGPNTASQVDPCMGSPSKR